MTQCQPGRILCHMRNIRPTAPGICDVEKYIATTEFITSRRTTYSEAVLVGAGIVVVVLTGSGTPSFSLPDSAQKL